MAVTLQRFLQKSQFCGCDILPNFPDQLQECSLSCGFLFLDLFWLLFLFSWLVGGFHWLRCSILWSWGDPMSADASSFRPRANSWSQISWSSKPDIDLSDPRTGYSLFGPHLGIVPTIFDICNSSNLAFKFSSIASFSLKVALSCNSWFSSFSIEMPKQFKH